MFELEQFIKTYGPYIGLFLYFFYKDMWPFLTDKVWPFYTLSAGKRKHKTTEEQLFDLLKDVVRTMTSLQVTLDNINYQLGEQARAIHSMNEDIAGLYGIKTRPSRIERDDK